jgi:hypothetical protein
MNSLLLFCCCAAADDSLVCSLEVNNTGNVRLQGVSVKGQAGCADYPTLLPGASFRCNVSKVSSQADFDAWDLTLGSTTAGDTRKLQLAATVTAQPVTGATMQPVTVTVLVAVPLLSRPSFKVLSAALLGGNQTIRAGEPKTTTGSDVCSIWLWALASILNGCRQVLVEVNWLMSPEGFGCLAAVVAGDTAMVSYSFANDGNVALRGLQFAVASDLTGVTCSPSLAGALAVGGNTTCSGSRMVTQTELEKGRNSYQLTLQADNIDPAGTSISTEFSRQAILPMVQLPVVALIQATLSTADCLKPAKARK